MIGKSPEHTPCYLRGESNEDTATWIEALSKYVQTTDSPTEIKKKTPDKTSVRRLAAAQASRRATMTHATYVKRAMQLQDQKINNVRAHLLCSSKRRYKAMKRRSKDSLPKKKN